MKINEYLADDGIFAAINATQELPFIDAFPVESLDLAYVTDCGYRTVRKEIEVVPVSTAGALLSYRFHDKWAKLYELLTDKLDLSYIGKASKERTQITDKTGLAMETRTFTHKVSAFNESEDYTPDYQDTEIITPAAGMDSITAATNETRRYFDDLKKGLNLLKSTLVYDIIFMDINKSLTLRVFDY